MTLETLKEKCEEEGFKYAFGKFTEKVEPPYLIATIIDSTNFYADNIVYYQHLNVSLDLATLKKEIKLQKKIEDNILSDITWAKEEGILADAEVYITSYFFELEEYKNES